MTHDRDSLRRVFLQELPACTLVRAAWFGGSDATQRTDRWSDVDLYVLVRPGGTADYVALQERWLARVAPVLRRFRLPEPTAHGARQEFIQFVGLPEEHMLDVCVLESFDPGAWIGVARHGTPQVIHDPESLLLEPVVDRDALTERLQARRATLGSTFPLFLHLAPKAARRGLPIEAQACYHSFVLRPLVELLRLRHCPQRHDYGLRYLEQDLPAEAYAELLALAWPTGIEALPRGCELASELFWRTMAQLERDGIRFPAPPA